MTVLTTAIDEPFRLFKVFRSLYERRLSGVLSLDCGEIRKLGHVIHGQPVRVSSNLPGESLVHALVEEGLISSTEAQTLVRETPQAENELGQRLVEAGLVAQSRIRHLEMRLARKRLLETFAWSSGTLTFEERPLRHDPSVVPISVVGLLVEAAARTLSDEICVRFVQAFRDQYIHPQEGDFEVFDRLFPPPNARTLLTLPQPFEQIARQTGEARRAARQVCALVVSGLCAFKRESAPVIAARAPAPLTRPEGIQVTRTAPGVELPPGPAAPPPRPPVARPQTPAGRPEVIPPRQEEGALGAGSVPLPPRPVQPAGPAMRTAPVSRPDQNRAASAPTAPLRGAPAEPARASAPTAPLRGAPGARPPAAPRDTAVMPPPAVRATAPMPPSRAAVVGEGSPSAPRPPANVAAHAPVQAPASTTVAGPLPEKVIARIQEAQRIAAELEKKTHYELLGVSRSADEKTIRDAFKSFAREYHVDRYARYSLPKDSLAIIQRVFIAFNRACEVLTTPDERKEYDLELEMKVKGGVPGASGGLAEVMRAEKLVREGHMLLKNGRAESAIDRFKEALGITPDDPLAIAGQVFAEYLIVHAHGGSPTVTARAKEKLEMLVKDYSAREEPFLYLGRIYRALNELDKASACFRQALEINEHCAEAASELRYAERNKPKADTGSVGLFNRRKK